MPNPVACVPLVTPTLADTAQFQFQLPESDKSQLEQLLNQAMSDPTFWYSETQLAPAPARISEASSKLEEVQEEMESLKLFGAGLAHDLGNVLTVILGNVELAKLCQQQAPAQEQSELGQVLHELEEAANMAKALHTQFRQLFQGTGLTREWVELKSVLEEATRLGLSGSGVACHFKLENPLPLVQVERCQLSEVIENLVLNAVQAMPNGGQIEVRAEALELVEGEVPGLRTGRYVEISVSDNGTGIAPQHLNMIFAPHFTTKAKGQGLGLAMCYSIIKRHQGHIGVESQVGVGTTFRVWLPLT